MLKNVFVNCLFLVSALPLFSQSLYKIEEVLLDWNIDLVSSPNDSILLTKSWHKIPPLIYRNRQDSLILTYSQNGNLEKAILIEDFWSRDSRSTFFVVDQIGRILESSKVHNERQFWYNKFKYTYSGNTVERVNKLDSLGYWSKAYFRKDDLDKVELLYGDTLITEWRYVYNESGLLSKVISTKVAQTSKEKNQMLFGRKIGSNSIGEPILDEEYFYYSIQDTIVEETNKNGRLALRIKSWKSEIAEFISEEKYSTDKTTVNNKTMPRVGLIEDKLTIKLKEKTLNYISEYSSWHNFKLSRATLQVENADGSGLIRVEKKALIDCHSDEITEFSVRIESEEDLYGETIKFSKYYNDQIAYSETKTYLNR